jgi:hypothetical protein
MNGTDDQTDYAQGGSFLKGIGLAFLCQFAYLLFVFELPASEVRAVGFMLFALVQFGYLFPLALFYQRRHQGLTSNGIMIAGAVSLAAATAWFGYSAYNGTLPSIVGS